MGKSLREQERKKQQDELKTQKKFAKKRDKTEKKYQKEQEKQGFATRSRKSENDKMREAGKKLNLAILIVAVLLVIMLLIVFLL